MEIQKVKKQILEKLTQLLNDKINMLEAVLASAKESRNGETKSTVGDKYETARAMADIEIQKNENQLNQLLRQRDDLTNIDHNQTPESAEYGSLIITNEEKYFISMGYGKIVLNNEKFFAISLASPIGNILKNKKAGDTFRFNGKDITIEQIG